MSGFNVNFLGENYKVNFPGLGKELSEISLNNGEIFDFTHFSLVMNKVMKSAIYVASNIDKSQQCSIKEERRWHFDDRIGKENQLGNEFYTNDNNTWDRGHLARRADLIWGSVEEAKKAQYDSCCWANISLQHHKFNTGIWNDLEDWVLDKAKDDILSKKLSIFTGPIYGEYSIEYCGANNPLGCKIFIPTAFWKSIFYINKSNDLKCISFIMTQKEYLIKGTLEDLKLLQPYQVKLEEISNITNLKFDDSLYMADVLNTDDKTIIKSNVHLIERKDNLILL